MLNKTLRTCLVTAGIVSMFGFLFWAWKRPVPPRPEQNLGAADRAESGASLVHAKPIRTSQLSSRSSLSAVSAIKAAAPLSEAAETARKIQILNEIFRTKNDNDPRLDQEFNHLSSDTKQALEQEYGSLHTESRNERGTIVFLIGRNLASREDFDFFHQVIAEPPCLSLGDCTKASDGEQTESSSQAEITLEYPQVVALKSLEDFLSQHLTDSPGSPETKNAVELLEEAERSQIPVVSQMASSIAHHLFPNGVAATKAPGRSLTSN